MAVAVRLESVFCFRHPPVSITSRNLCACAHVKTGNLFVIRLKSLPFPQSQRLAIFQVRCSSTADASRDSCMPFPTLYELLEIPQHVGLPEIKLAYRQMARRYHPDVCPPTEKEECTRRFMQVQEAYDTLSDPHLRADYDLWLQNPLNAKTLSAGFRAGNRRRTGKFDMDVSDDWRDHWKSQLQELRRREGRGVKEESWASRMRKKREVENQTMYLDGDGDMIPHFFFSACDARLLGP
uniref:J domain-containing protein n=2 Tax=Physcomitrium patens TaxID=3218 RepID=A0A7I3ZZ52_PHYPA